MSIKLNPNEKIVAMIKDGLQKRTATALADLKLSPKTNVSARSLESKWQTPILRDSVIADYIIKVKTDKLKVL